VARRIEDTVVKHRRGARNIVGARSTASSVCPDILGPKRIQGGGRDSGRGGASRSIFRHQLHFGRIRLGRLGERQESRILICLHGLAVGSQRPIGLDGKEEEQLVPDFYRQVLCCE